MRSQRKRKTVIEISEKLTARLRDTATCEFEHLRHGIRQRKKMCAYKKEMNIYD